MNQARKTRGISATKVGIESLQKAKSRRGWSFEELALQAEKAPKTVKNFFGGERVDPDTAAAITKALELTFEDVVNLDELKEVWREAQSKDKPVSPNWRELSRRMLESQKQLTSNVIMNDESAKFERNQVYVPLALVQRTKPDLRRGKFSPEWGMKLYEPQYEEKQRFDHNDFLADILKEGKGKTKGKRIALIGEPGAGKTTFLQLIAFWVLDNNLGLPIWISLADLQGRDIQEYLLNVWLKQAIPEPQLTDAVKYDFIQQIEQGQVWLLLDGVDEMISNAKTQPPIFLQWAKPQLTGWIAPARVVLTCRLNVWLANLNTLEVFETYRLLDFCYPDKVNKFISKWFSNDPAKGERLETELKKTERTRLQDLVKNPLRLALLCSTWQRWEGNLPDTLSELYKTFVKGFYHWKNAYIHTTLAERRELHSALGRLALRDIGSSLSRFRLRESFIIEELGDPEEEGSLFYLAKHLGWLNEVGIAAENPDEKVYAFLHPTFEEYFAAMGINDWHFFFHHKPHDIQQGIYRIFEPQWKQVILLWLGRDDNDLHKQHKEEFINALLKFKDGCGGVYSTLSFCLAALGIQEFLNLNFVDATGTISNYNHLFIKVILPELFSIAFGYINYETFEFYSAGTGRKKILIDTFKEMNNQLIVYCLEYEINILRTSLAKDWYYELSNNETINISKSSRRAEYFLYFNMFNVGDFIVSYFHVKNIYKLNLNYFSESIQRRKTRQKKIIELAYVLGKINSQSNFATKALEELIPEIKDRLIHWQAVISLSLISPKNIILEQEIDKLITTTKDGDIFPTDQEFWRNFIGKENIIGSLIKLTEEIKNESTLLQITQILQVVGCKNENVIVTLVKLIETEGEEVSWYAFFVLQQIAKDNKNVIDYLVQLSKSKNESTSLLAFVHLHILLRFGKITLQTFILLENNITKNQDLSCIIRSIVNPVTQDNLSDINTLIKIINKEKNENKRRLAVLGLSKITKKNQSSITTLVDLLCRTKKAFTCDQALNSLRYILLKDKVNILAESLVKIIAETNNEYTCSAASKILKDLYPNAQGYNTIKALKDIEVDLPSFTITNNYFKYYYFTDRVFNITPISIQVREEVFFHYAQNMTYQDFYIAYHELPANFLPETTDTPLIQQSQVTALKRETLNKSQTLSISSTIKTQVFCVRVKTLAGETDTSTIAKGLCNRIFTQVLSQEVPPEVRDVFDLERHLIQLKQRLQKQNLALILYDGEPEKKLVEFFQKLTEVIHIAWITPISVEPPLKGLLPNQPDLASAIQSWLDEIG